MSISDKLTQQKLLEILITTYNKGHETENIQIIDLLKELEQEFLSVINTK